MKNGYVALCLTVDLDYYGRRERDLAKRYITTSRRTNAIEHYQARFSWAGRRQTQEALQAAFIIKGIAHAEDAKICVEEGIEGVYVSNHGGRQLDHGLGRASTCLPKWWMRLVVARK